MTLYELIAKALADNGYDGLVHESSECGCLIEDLAPCGELNCEECIPGYKSIDKEGDWIISTEKEQQR